ncbi:MAG: cytochrome-c oxidase, cbb3-type subunit III [Rubellimicrobium sp.]|nr:cytochrome-c oxidase, cbb3-type subunit III [Rubellimicrobium sp.]
MTTDVTDPRELEGADPHTGERGDDPLLEHGQEIDPVTGHITTGHDWNGIKELNTPFPKIALWALIISVVYSVITWVLLPAWPLGSTYTKGLLGVDQTTDADAEHARLVDLRAHWREGFASDDFAALADDADVMALALPEMRRLYADNCAACHGAEGQGRTGHGVGGAQGAGFPALNDDEWLWYSEPEDIADVIRVGINSDHPDTYFAEMPAFGRDGMLERSDIDLLVPWVAGLSAGTSDPDSEAAGIFADTCAACHGDGGTGGLESGAPSLVDAEWIYGGSEQAIRATIWNGRSGHMPAWEDRLSDEERNMLALYVAGLSQAGAQ